MGLGLATGNWHILNQCLNCKCPSILSIPPCGICLLGLFLGYWVKCSACTEKLNQALASTVRGFSMSWQTLEIYKAAHLSMVCVTGESTGNNIFSQKIGVSCKLSHHSWKPQKEAFLVSGHVEQGVHQCSFLQLLLLRFLRGACSWKRQQRGQVRERLLQGDWETRTQYIMYI